MQTIDFNDLNNIKFEPLPDDPEDALLVKILEDIEKENQATNTDSDTNKKQQNTYTAPTSNNSLVTNTVNNVCNNTLQQSRRINIPQMYFPHSNVTINYNIINK